MRISLDEFLCSAVAQACNVDRCEVQAEKALVDLGLDSLGLVSVLAQVEAVYEVELSPDQILSVMEASTVAQLTAKIRSKLAELSEVADT